MIVTCDGDHPAVARHFWELLEWGRTTNYELSRNEAILLRHTFNNFSGYYSDVFALSFAAAAWPWRNKLAGSIFSRFRLPLAAFLWGRELGRKGSPAPLHDFLFTVSNLDTPLGREARSRIPPDLLSKASATRRGFISFLFLESSFRVLFKGSAINEAVGDATQVRLRLVFGSRFGRWKLFEWATKTQDRGVKVHTFKLALPSRPKPDASALHILIATRRVLKYELKWPARVWHNAHMWLYSFSLRRKKE